MGVVLSILMKVPELSDLEEFEAQGQILKESFSGQWVLQWSPLLFVGVKVIPSRRARGPVVM